MVLETETNMHALCIATGCTRRSVLVVVFIMSLSLLGGAGNVFFHLVCPSVRMPV